MIRTYQQMVHTDVEEDPTAFTSIVVEEMLVRKTARKVVLIEYDFRRVWVSANFGYLRELKKVPSDVLDSYDDIIREADLIVYIDYMSSGKLRSIQVGTWEEVSRQVRGATGLEPEIKGARNEKNSQSKP